MRVVDQAFAAFEKTTEEGVKEITHQTIESPDNTDKPRLTGRSVTHRVRKDAGDPRFLEVAMKSLREIRDLFGIGVEAESKLSAASSEGGLAIEALLRTGAARLTTRWNNDLKQDPIDHEPDRA
jgi:hypothetical protein